MRVLFDFMGALRRMPLPWQAWLMLLMAVNLGGVLVFPASVEGRVTAGVFLASALLMTALFQAFGFVRLLGLGHILWVPLVLWLWSRYDAAPSEGGFRLWLGLVMTLNTLSLFIDAVDVARYLRGERAPSLPPPG